MNRRDFLKTLSTGIALYAAPGAAGAVKSNRKSRPNVVLIFVDDLGYGDVGYHGTCDVPTPNIDSIASAGTQFSTAYVTAAVCGPSRAGLLSGQYQQRFGFDDNPGPFTQSAEVRIGTPLDRPNIAERLKELGYTTGMVGKWHEGDDERHQPHKRGFDEYFGFNNGAAEYFIKNNPKNRLLRNGKPVAREDAYLTDAFGREAAAFVRKHKNRPFFLYASFNAVHGPLQAPESEIASAPKNADPKRRILAAMLSSLDRNIGQILGAIRKCGLESNTLVIFWSDNGGKPTGNRSLNTPLRGMKGQYYEGGIRVPACMKWPGAIPADKRYDQPVSTLDVMPTALSAAGTEICPNWKLDGVNLLDHLNGKKKTPPHRMLYWRQLYHWAIRDTDWKLVKMRNADQPQLFHISRDKCEKEDLFKKRPDIVKRLTEAYGKWNAGLMKPQWGWQPGICGKKYNRPKQ
ncbi:MAG: sulfatase-like hydrolase/transferase [Phycisphaerae bacterium]|jgi:arylsulfatase A-like enzyme|nr:sulfatase-like hydrolase/transferase [Phycisphaerae bacterium]